MKSISPKYPCLERLHFSFETSTAIAITVGHINFTGTIQYSRQLRICGVSGTKRLLSICFSKYTTRNTETWFFFVNCFLGRSSKCKSPIYSKIQTFRKCCLTLDNYYITNKGMTMRSESQNKDHVYREKSTP